MGTTSSAPSTRRVPSQRRTSRTQTQKEPALAFHGLLSALRLEGNGSRPRSGSFGGSSFLSKSSHSCLAASKRHQLLPSRSTQAETMTPMSSECASPVASDGSRTPTNPAYYDSHSTSRGRRAEAEADGKIHRSRSDSIQLLKDALAASSLDVPQQQPRRPHRRLTREPDAVRPEADAMDKRHRSQSPAVPCRRPDKALLDLEEEDEITVAQAEKMYDRATWRMYDRIMTARALRQQQQQLEEAAFYAGKGRCQNIKVSSAVPQVQKVQQPLYKVPPPFVPAADGPWKDTCGQEGIGEESSSHSHSYPNVFSLDMDH